MNDLARLELVHRAAQYCKLKHATDVAHSQVKMGQIR